MLFRISAFWARLELGAAALLALAVTVLILLNVVTRTAGAALFWVDELAIYAMAWMTFLGASASLHYRTAVAITLVPDAVGPAAKAAIARAVDVVVFLFGLSMIWFCWRWFLPLDMARAGFDPMTFQGQTFNFIYAEPTSTLGWPKWIFWLVMWLFALGATLHSLAHLTRRAPPEARP